MDVAIDNNVASDWLDESLRARTIAKFRTSGARMVLPFEALIEIAVNANRPKVRAQYAAVREVLSTLGDDAAGVGLPFHLALRRERFQTQYEVPTVTVSQLRNLFDGVAGNAPLDDLAAYLGAAERFSIDKSMDGELLKSGINATWEGARTTVPALLANILAPGAFGLEEYVKDPRWAARVQATPANYPVAVTVSAIVNVQASAAMLPMEAKGGFHGMLKIQRSDWVDIWSVSASGGAEIFVTNDGLLRDRIAYVCEHAPIVRIRAMSAEDWLTT